MKLVKFKLITTSLVGIIVCSSLVITPTHADTPASSSSSANASITVANTINLTLTGGDLVIDNLTPGNASDSNIITATITSNSPYGYHLSATTGTSTGTTSLVNTADSNFVFTNLNANKASLSNFSDNTWGYSYSTDNGTSWISGDYGTALAGYNGLTLDNDDSGATGTTLFNNDSYAGSTAVKFKIGAKSATTQAAGTYTGTVNFYAVTNPGPDNTMQGFAAGNASTTCTAMSTGDTLKLTDSRDDTEYTIGKLADGNCWLLDNLALDLTNSTVLNGMNENNTHASNTTLSYLKGTTTRDPSTDPNGKYATSAVSTLDSTSSYSDPRVNLASKDLVPSDAISQAGQYRIGGYYNYCAVSAGSYCYGDGKSGGSPSGDTTEDICPKGWKMPTGKYDGEYRILYDNTNYNTSIKYRSALRLPFSGYYIGGSASHQGSVGYFWSPNYSSSSDMYFLELKNNNVYTASSINRIFGNSVRCILGI